METNPLLNVQPSGIDNVDHFYFREWNSIAYKFNSDYGFLLNKVPSEVVKQIDIDINDIKNSSNKVRANTKLAGQIENEFMYPPSSVIENYIKGIVEKYEISSNGYISKHLKKQFTDKSTLKLSLSHLWVNFQKKYEYNPMHDHSGVLSFVIWHKNPFLYRDEVKQDPAKKGNLLCTNGLFSFVFSDGGRVLEQYIPVDKNWEGYIAVFPSNLLHQVYPFYTSNDYRISISGNIMFQHDERE